MSDHAEILVRSSAQLEDEAEGVVNRFEFVVWESSDEFAEAFVGYFGCLLDEDLGVVTVDRDRGTKDPRRRRP